MVSLNKRTSMALFSDPTDHYCQRVRIVLEEKGISSEIIDTDKNSINYQHCLYWFKKSSAHGYNGATYCLALCYIKGLGMKKKKYLKKKLLKWR